MHLVAWTAGVSITLSVLFIGFGNALSKVYGASIIEKSGWIILVTSFFVAYSLVFLILGKRFLLPILGKRFFPDDFSMIFIIMVFNGGFHSILGSWLYFIPFNFKKDAIKDYMPADIFFGDCDNIIENSFFLRFLVYILCISYVLLLFIGFSISDKIRFKSFIIHALIGIMLPFAIFIISFLISYLFYIRMGGGVVRSLVIPITILISKPVSKIWMFILLRGHKKLWCKDCFRYSFPFKSKYEDGVRYCEHCNGVISKGKKIVNGIYVKKVIGLIGGNVINYQISGEKCYVNLYDSSKNSSRNADIDTLEIREGLGDELDYGKAIDSVVMTLKGDVSRERNYLKRVDVIIKGKPPISENAKRILMREFKSVREV